MPLAFGVIDSAQMGFHREMNCVPDVGILADASLESATHGFPDKLDFHPSSRVRVQANCALRNRIGTDLRHNAKQVLIALRDSDKTADLSDAVGLPIDNGESRGHGHGKMDTYGGARYCGHSTQKGGITA
jgi:hypothetical protein